jgi:hypothetical protein
MVLTPCHLTTFALAALCFGTAAAAPYCNDRYGYCVIAPAALYPQGEADARDGQVFLSRNASVTLRVYGQWAMEPFTYEGLYRDAARGWPAEGQHGARVVTYKLFRPGFFVVSGLENGKVFYQRTIHSARKGAYATYVLEYRDGDRVAERYLKGLTTSLKF